MSRGSLASFIDSTIEAPPQAYLAPEPTDEEWPGNGINPPDLLSRHQVRSQPNGSFSVDQTRQGSQFDPTAYKHESSSSAVKRHRDSSDCDSNSKYSSVLPPSRTGGISDDRAALYNLADPWEPSLNPPEDRTRPTGFSVPTHQEQTSALHNALWTDGLEYGNLIKRKDKIDPADVAFNEVARMSHRQRRKAQDKQKEITACVTSMINRQTFIRTYALALLHFGAASHRITEQLTSAALILNVPAGFTQLPNIVIVAFGDKETHSTETHVIKSAGKLQLGRLDQVQEIYNRVKADEYSAKFATRDLKHLIAQHPIYTIPQRCFCSFWLAVLICPLSFGGSFVDCWLAGVGAFLLCLVQLTLSSWKPTLANVFEILVAMLMSFVARALSTYRRDVFCFTASSSSAVIGMLPGYLILTSSLELGSKNITSGSIKMIYALIFTLFLGFGLQLGSDIYLLFDVKAFNALKAASEQLTGTLTLSGTFIADDVNATMVPAVSKFSFTNALPPDDHFMNMGCYRPPTDPWYLRSFPPWTQFIIVPVFSGISSLSNLQPFDDRRSRINLLVMIIISCAAYATNKVATHYIFNHSDVVSAIGAFTVGIMGSVWAKNSKGSGFACMVTGILFLVPSSLSQAGGITTSANGVDVGQSMIQVSVGITVGLFVSQAVMRLFTAEGDNTI